PPPPPGPPTLDFIPDLTVVEGGTLDRDVGAADPQMVTWSFTGPAFMNLTPADACAVQHADLHLAPPLGASGTYAASVTVAVGSQSAPRTFTIDVTAAAPQAQPVSYDANVILTGDNRTIRLASRTDWCAQLEPAQASFQVENVVPSSLLAKYADAQIHATDVKTMKASGRNNASMLAGFFGKEDLRHLFSSLPNGKQTV